MWTGIRKTSLTLQTSPTVVNCCSNFTTPGYSHLNFFFFLMALEHCGSQSYDSDNNVVDALRLITNKDSQPCGLHFLKKKSKNNIEIKCFVVVDDIPCVYSGKIKRSSVPSLRIWQLIMLPIVYEDIVIIYLVNRLLHTHKRTYNLSILRH